MNSLPTPNIDDVRTIHMTAICGTGMGALAGILKDSGYIVTGSDQNVYPPMSTQLENLGIKIMTGFSADNLAHNPDLVIIGNVIRKDNPEAVQAIKMGIPYISFPGALRAFYLSQKRTIAVCGTHGKTTTTALLAHVFHESGLAPSYLVGGVMLNAGSGFRKGEGGDFIIEGDEYDTAFFDKVPKFIRYEPDWAIVANIEFDHADIYSSLDQIIAQFEKLIVSVPEEGLIFAGIDCEIVKSIISKAEAKVVTFGLDSSADARPASWNITDGVMHFEPLFKGESLGEMSCSLAGEHNLMNIMAAIAVSKSAGIPNGKIAGALKSFQGIKRRQEVKGHEAGVTVIDDFAHHPTAVQKTLHALKSAYAGRRIVAVFEPRTNTSRRNFFQDRYAMAFNDADEVFIAPVFGLEDIEPELRFNPAKLIDDLNKNGVTAHYPESHAKLLSALLDVAEPDDVMVLMSNGGFGGLHDKLLRSLKHRVDVKG